MPPIFASAVKKSVKVWDDSYQAPTDATLTGSYNAFLALSPQAGETTYYKSDGGDGYEIIGKVNNWSWFDETSGDWGVGENYDVYDQDKAAADEWPWDWAGGSNTHSWGGEINTWSNYTVQVAVDAQGHNAAYTVDYLAGAADYDAGDDSSDPLAYYTEIGSNKQYDAGGDVVWENSFEWNYVARTTANDTAEISGQFLGGKETREDGTFTYDKNWNVLTRTKELDERCA